MGRPRYDWVSIRQEYISTDISTKELAEKYGIRRRTVEDKCAKEGWVQKRRNYVTDVAERVTDKVTESVAIDKAEGLANLYRAANNFAQVIADYSDRILNGGEKLRGSEVAHLHECMKIEEELIRSIGHMPTDLQKHKMEMESKRLQMEQQKADAFNPDTEIVIKVEGYEEGWSE